MLDVIGLCHCVKENSGNFRFFSSDRLCFLTSFRKCVALPACKSIEVTSDCIHVCVCIRRWLKVSACVFVQIVVLTCFFGLFIRHVQCEFGGYEASTL